MPYNIEALKPQIRRAGREFNVARIATESLLILATESFLILMVIR
jgi:hypothetical protein